MKTVTLKDGMARLREEADIKIRHKRIVEAAAVAAAPVIAKLPSEDPETIEKSLSELQIDAAEATLIFNLQDATIVAALDSWTLPQPLPTLATIGDLDVSLYEELAELTKSTGAAIASGVSFEPVDPASDEFNASPTLPSSDFGRSLRDESESVLTTPQQITGESTVLDHPFTD